MKNFSHHPGNGFSFLEIVGSLLIMGVLLTALFSMEGSVLGRFRKSVQRENHLYDLKNYVFSLTQVGTDLQKKQEIKTEAETITLTTEPVKKGSVLARFEGLQQQKVMTVWHDEKKERSLELIAYIFVPPVSAKASSGDSKSSESKEGNKP